MADVRFTPNLQRHVDCPPETVDGATLREALDHVFELHPGVARYVLDDQGALRRHMVVFIDGAPCRDRVHLSDPVSERCEILVMQALSGG